MITLYLKALSTLKVSLGNHEFLKVLRETEIFSEYILLYPRSTNKVWTVRSFFHVFGKINMVIFKELDFSVAFVKMEFLIYFKTCHQWKTLGERGLSLCLAVSL